MQENNFENKIRLKMDELKLHPSESVWLNVESRIKKENRRRWFIFFFCLILSGILFGGYFLITRNNTNRSLLTTTSTKQTKSINNNIVKENTDPINKKTLTKTEKPITTQQDIKQITNKKIAKEVKTSISVSQNNSGPFLSRDSKRSIINSNITDDINNTSIPKKENEKLQTEINNSETTNLITPKNKDSIIVKENILPDIASKELTNDSLQKKNENITSNNKKNTSKKNKHAWNSGFSFAAGISGVGKNFLNPSYSYMYANPATLGLPLTTTPSPNPSIIKSTSAFIFGFAAEKNISKKIKFVTALNYKIYSTKNTTGTDSAAFFRSNNVSNTYHNIFHYLQLPVGIKFQFFDHKKIKFYLSCGFAISEFISSNALQFNYSTGLYYRDNSLLKKTQLEFNACLDMEFFFGNKKSLLIGPYLNYGLSKIAADGYYNHPFTFIGLRTQYFFTKK